MSSPHVFQDLWASLVWSICPIEQNYTSDEEVIWAAAVGRFLNASKIPPTHLYTFPISVWNDNIFSRNSFQKDLYSEYAGWTIWQNWHIERALKKDNISRHYSTNKTCNFSKFAKWSTSAKNVISPKNISAPRIWKHQRMFSTKNMFNHFFSLDNRGNWCWRIFY